MRGTQETAHVMLCSLKDVTMCCTLLPRAKAAAGAQSVSTSRAEFVAIKEFVEIAKLEFSSRGSSKFSELLHFHTAGSKAGITDSS